MKRFLTFLVVLFLATELWALDIGIQAAIGQNKLIGDAVDSDIHEEVGYRFGVILRQNLSEHFDLRSGILYSYRKYQVMSLFTNPFPPYNDTKYEVQASYIDVPILAQLKVFSWLNIFAGPVVGFNTKGKIKGNDNFGQIDMDIKDSITSPYLLGQAGINFDFGRFGLDFIYERGFNDFFKNDSNVNFTFIGMNLNLWLYYNGDDNDYEDVRTIRPYRFQR